MIAVPAEIWAEMVAISKRDQSEFNDEIHELCALVLKVEEDIK